MRIISGDYKGRKLETPADNRIRPTTEKVKEALFSTLMPYLNDSICLDMFAGTGGLGIEALSRGCSKCYFSDNDRTSISLINTNINNCKANEYSVVLSGDFERNLNRISEKIDIILMDPPYGEGLYDRAFQTISELNLLNEGGVIVAEHNNKLELPDTLYSYKKFKEKKYGTIIMSFYQL